MITKSKLRAGSISLWTISPGFGRRVSRRLALPAGRKLRPVWVSVSTMDDSIARPSMRSNRPAPALAPRNCDKVRRSRSASTRRMRLPAAAPSSAKFSAVRVLPSADVVEEIRRVRPRWARPPSISWSASPWMESANQFPCAFLLPGNRPSKRRPALVPRRRRSRDHAQVGAVDRSLFAGFPGAHQEGLVDGSARLHLPFEFAQPDRCQAGGNRILLETFQVAFERLLARLGSFEIALGRSRDPRELAIDELLNVVNLRVQGCNVRMARPQPSGQIRPLANDRGVLQAQLPDGLRLDRFGGGTEFRACPSPALDLLDAGTRFGRPRAGMIELNVHLAELLLVYEYPAGSDDAVLFLVVHDPLFRVMHPVAERLQTSAELA